MRVVTPILALAVAALCAGCGRVGVSPGGASGVASTFRTSGGGDGSGGTLVIGMTAANVPPLDTVLAAAQGYEGVRFVGNQLYDGMTRWDLRQGTAVPRLTSGLATAWRANKAATAWTFDLRPGVRFTDGTPWDADAAIFNLNRYTNPKAPTSSAAIVGQAATLGGGVMKRFTKLSPTRLRIELNTPDAHLPEDLATLFMASPTALRREGAKGFATHPVGTGPFEFDSLQQGQQLTLKPNPRYWRGKPKLDKLILKPIPDAAARLAALRSGSANWVEYPNPDDIDGLRSSGFQVLANAYDHIWPWIFDTATKPWSDKRLRQAANYAIDRRGMTQSLLHGTADPAAQLVPRANSAYRPAADRYDYDPAKAKALLRAAGYPHGVDLRVEYPTSGSGNMIPAPMNEALQRDLAAVGIRVKLVPIEWAAMLAQLTSGAMPKGIDAMNVSLTFQAESTWPLLFSSKGPINVGHYANPAVDKALGAAQSAVDLNQRSADYAAAAAHITDDAAWLFVVNDRNPRVLAPSVHGFTEPKSWFIDLTTTWVA